jgi:hypothetical protein
VPTSRYRGLRHDYNFYRLRSAMLVPASCIPFQCNLRIRIKWSKSDAGYPRIGLQGRVYGCGGGSGLVLLMDLREGQILGLWIRRGGLRRVVEGVFVVVLEGVGRRGVDLRKQVRYESIPRGRTLLESVGGSVFGDGDGS